MHRCLSLSVSNADTVNLWKKVTACKELGGVVPGLSSQVSQEELLGILQVLAD